ncbi:MAG: alanine racemase [Gemmatimonadetes bacterium]|nr:alanine racemase [Gemmatimonadota bacterium]
MAKSTRTSRERAWVEVSLANIAANAETIRAASRGARLLPMVKANGYGLGAVPVARTLEPAVDPWGFGVATVEEGVELREAGISRPIVVFTPGFAESEPRYREFRLTAVLEDPAAIRRWTIPYHIEIDTGMGRSGIRWDQRSFAEHRTAQMEGAFMHFHSAETDPASIQTQWERFQRALRDLGERPRLVYVANSAAVFRHPVSLDLVRPGIFLYGCKPAPDFPKPRAAASLKARVVSVRRIPRGESVSYGAEWVARRDSLVATIGLGYADGFSRVLQDKAQVLIGGRRFPQIGRITMDMIMADVTDAPGSAPVAAGEVATLVGRDGSEEITWDDLAGWAGTNTYEMLSRLGDRVERVYVDGE